MQKQPVIIRAHCAREWFHAQTTWAVAISSPGMEPMPLCLTLCTGHAGRNATPEYYPGHMPDGAEETLSSTPQRNAVVDALSLSFFFSRVCDENTESNAQSLPHVAARLPCKRRMISGIGSRRSPEEQKSQRHATGSTESLRISNEHLNHGSK